MVTVEKCSNIFCKSSITAVNQRRTLDVIQHFQHFGRFFGQKKAAEREVGTLERLTEKLAVAEG